VRILRALLLLFWCLGVLVVILGVMERGALSRERAAVGDMVISARATGQDLAPLQAREREVAERMARARNLALIGVAVVLLLPLGWGLQKGLARRWGRRETSAEETPSDDAG